MVALNEVVSAEGLTLDPALLAQVEHDTLRPTGRGVEPINIQNWKRQHAKGSAVRGGGGIDALSASLPTPSTMLKKSKVTKTLQFSQLPPDEEAYSRKKYERPEQAAGAGVLCLRPPNQLAFTAAPSRQPLQEEESAPPEALGASAQPTPARTQLGAAAVQVVVEGEGPPASGDEAPPSARRLRGTGQEPGLWSPPSSYVHPSAPGAEQDWLAVAAAPTQAVAAAVSLARRDFQAASVACMRREPGLADSSGARPRARGGGRTAELSEMLSVQKQLQQQNQRLETQLQHQALVLQRLAANHQPLGGPSSTRASNPANNTKNRNASSNCTDFNTGDEFKPTRRGTAPTLTGKALCDWVAESPADASVIRRNKDALRRSQERCAPLPKDTKKSAAQRRHHEATQAAVLELVAASDRGEGAGELVRAARAQAEALVGPHLPLQRDSVIGPPQRRRSARGWDDRPPSPPKRQPRSLLRRTGNEAPGPARQLSQHARGAPGRARAPPTSLSSSHHLKPELAKATAAALLEREVARQIQLELSGQDAAGEAAGAVAEALASFQRKLAGLVRSAESQMGRGLEGDDDTSHATNVKEKKVNHDDNASQPAADAADQEVPGVSPSADDGCLRSGEEGGAGRAVMTPHGEVLRLMEPAVHSCLEKLQALELREARMAQRWLTPTAHLPQQLSAAIESVRPAVSLSSGLGSDQGGRAVHGGGAAVGPDVQPSASDEASCYLHGSLPRPMPIGGNALVAAAAGRSAHKAMEELQWGRDQQQHKPRSNKAEPRAWQPLPLHLRTVMDSSAPHIASATSPSGLGPWRSPLKPSRDAGASGRHQGAWHEPTALNSCMVRRVLEARDSFLQRQALLDGVLVAAARDDGEDASAFDPVEVVEKVAEGLTAEVVEACMSELVRMMDSFVEQVVENEFA